MATGATAPNGVLMRSPLLFRELVRSIWLAAFRRGVPQRRGARGPDRPRRAECFQCRTDRATAYREESRRAPGPSRHAATPTKRGPDEGSENSEARHAHPPQRSKLGGGSDGLRRTGATHECRALCQPTQTVGGQTPQQGGCSGAGCARPHPPLPAVAFLARGRTTASSGRRRRTGHVPVAEPRVRTRPSPNAVSGRARSGELRPRPSGRR